MSNDVFRPRIDGEVHDRIRLCYFDDNLSDYSKIYQGLADLVFNEDGKKRPWYYRAEQLAEDKDITVEEALNNLIVSSIDEEGEFKPGANQLYARNNSIGE